jgi:hypothetical protein
MACGGVDSTDKVVADFASLSESFLPALELGGHMAD